MGERDINSKIKKELIEKHHFNEDWIKIEPNKEEITIKSIRDVVWNTDLYYFNERAKFLFLFN